MAPAGSSTRRVSSKASLIAAQTASVSTTTKSSTSSRVRRNVSSPTSFTAAFLGGANLIPCTVGRVIGTSALVSFAGKTVSAEAPQPAVGRAEWAPDSQALLCIRPHALKVGSLNERGAVRATVNAAVWRGATTRLVLAVTDLPDRLIEVDVPGHDSFDIGSEVGLTFPDPAGVLVQAAP